MLEGGAERLAITGEDQVDVVKGKGGISILL